MQSHTGSLLHADWSLASTNPHLAPHHQLYLHHPLLSMSTITVINSGILFIVFITCNCFPCSNVNNAQQKTKHDGQAVWCASVHVFLSGLLKTLWWEAMFSVTHLFGWTHRVRIPLKTNAPLARKQIFCFMQWQQNNQWVCWAISTTTGTRGKDILILIKHLRD